MREGGLDHPAVIELLRFHVREANANTPVANAHALDIDALRHLAIRFWSAWDGDTLLGMAALKELEPGHGEVKSMRVHPDHLRRGVASALLGHIVATARGRGYTRLSLETGTAPAFAPANALYERAGFVDGPVFGGYPASEHNRFMTLVLQEQPA
nr:MULTISPECIES: GNAT family N-acetyltransferase [unclassified Sphingomonas]